MINKIEIPDWMKLLISLRVSISRLGKCANLNPTINFAILSCSEFVFEYADDPNYIHLVHVFVLVESVLV
jgi:hypothetical protein